MQLSHEFHMHHLIWTLFVSLTQSTGQYLSYLTLGITPGVTSQYLSRVDDGASSNIPIPGGFRFGTSSMTNVYVGFLIDACDA